MMRLCLESGLVLDAPTDQQIRDGIEEEEWAILEPQPEADSYMQCSKLTSGEYNLEYQAGSLKEHYRAVDRSVTLTRVHEAFLNYRKGNPTWQRDFEWERIDL